MTATPASTAPARRHVRTRAPAERNAATRQLSARWDIEALAALRPALAHARAEGGRTRLCWSQSPENYSVARTADRHTCSRLSAAWFSFPGSQEGHKSRARCRTLSAPLSSAENSKMIPENLGFARITSSRCDDRRRAPRHPRGARWASKDRDAGRRLCALMYFAEHQKRKVV